MDEYIEQDSPVRYIDAFVDSQNLEELGFNHVSQETPEKGGRPPYDPRDMLKLYVYGYGLYSFICGFNAENTHFKDLDSVPQMDIKSMIPNYD